ncbi:MAG: EF-hand domain-containing protein [Lysobacter sp.]
MKPSVIRASSIRMSFLAAAMVLAGTALAAPQAASDKTGTDRHREHPMLKLDTNGDGVIDRAEAAAHPRLAEKFAQLDRNGDGKLERDEFRRGHGERGGRNHKGHQRQGGQHGGFARYIALDTDGDGRINKLEAAPSPLAARFASIDRNHDGYLVRSELQADREQRRAEFAAKRAERFEQQFKQADSNQDGRLSRAEFEAAWPQKAKLFAFLDEDRDGYLNRADVAPQQRG